MRGSPPFRFRCSFDAVLAAEVDDGKPADDGDQVLDEGGGEVLAEGFGEGTAGGGSAQGAGDGSEPSGDQAEAEGLVREAEGCSAEGAGDDAGNELGWDLAAGCSGALVVADLGEGKQGEDAKGNGGAEEGKRCPGQADPANVGAPGDDGGGSEGAESGNDADQEGEGEDGHGALLGVDLGKWILSEALKKSHERVRGPTTCNEYYHRAAKRERPKAKKG